VQLLKSIITELEALRAVAKRKNKTSKIKLEKNYPSSFATAVKTWQPDSHRTLVHEWVQTELKSFPGC
jgi:hypothetical protein